jgi:hypothetical protein
VRYNPARMSTWVRPSVIILLGLPSLVLAQPAKPDDSVPPPTTGAASESPPTPSPTTDLDSLRRELDALRKRIAAQEAARERLTHLDKRIGELEEKSKLQVRAGRFGFTLSGFVHADLNAYRQSSRDEVDAAGEPLNDMRFNIKRSRLRAVIEYRFLIGAFEIDANTNKGLQVRPQSFEIGVRYLNPRRPALPYLTVHMGLVRAPFGFEVQQSDKERIFLERAIVIGAIYPGEYDLGIRAFGAWRFLRYALAGMNGDPIGGKNFPGRDPNRSKDVIAFVGADHTFGRVQLRGGFSVDYGHGFHKGTPAGSNGLAWRDANQDGVLDIAEITGVPGAAATPSSNFTRYAIGADAGVMIKLPRVGVLSLLGEIVHGVNMDRNLVIADPVAAKHDLRELGWYLGVTQELTAYAAVGVRYDRYDPDRDAIDPATGARLRTLPYSQWVATAMARLPGYARLTLEYGHVEKPNGHAADGTPIALRDNQLTLRGEVTF